MFTELLFLNNKINPLIIFWEYFPLGSYNLLSSRLLSKNFKTNLHKTVILPVVFYECATLSLTLRQEHTLVVFENRMLRRIFGHEREAA